MKPMPHMHYHPWCDDCQSLMDWELPQPTKPRPKKSILPFGDLKTVVKARLCYWSPFATQIKAQNALARITLEWRDEQFARAVIKRSG